MLRLKDIRKTYESGGVNVPALKGINLNFRKSEFVSILGQSGCGKTTLLNIIGGLDRYTSGDLIIAANQQKITLIKIGTVIVTTPLVLFSKIITL